LINKAVATPNDLRGVKLDSLGDAVSYFTAMGAPATAIDPGDVYSSLEKRLVDGQATHWALMGVYATVDFEKYHTIFGELGKNGDGGLYAPSIGYAINSNAWNKLPADLQQILVTAFDYGGDQMIEMDLDLITNTRQLCIDRGDTFVYVKGDDLNPWYEWMDRSNAEWFAACKRAGYDGEKLYNNLLETLKRYTP
jgi:TRAP-type C4-dicarboxylate transport system substrate-binding protein